MPNVVCIYTSKWQVIADFDATLTKYWVDGQRGHSMLSLFLPFGIFACLFCISFNLISNAQHMETGFWIPVFVCVTNYLLKM